MRLSVFVSIIITCLTLSCRPRNESSGTLAEGLKAKGAYPVWAYDAGPLVDDPDPETRLMARELVELNADIPHFPTYSRGIYGRGVDRVDNMSLSHEDQMFRPAFGPVPWRMILKPNSVKMLFIGQDATHIAEAAGRPATAGFGGRAQDLARYFGVNSSAAFINTYAFTIRWQYGAFDTPILTTRNGRTSLSYASFTSNPVWLISQDLDSPITQWRNRLIDWIIRNNRNSIKMVVLFGGAARDAMGAYISWKGGVVEPMRKFEGVEDYLADEEDDDNNPRAEKVLPSPQNRMSDAETSETLDEIKVPEFGLAGAGSNKQTPYPYGKRGQDLFEEFEGKEINYKATDQTSVKKMRERFQQNASQWIPKMVLPTGGLSGSGMIHPAQLQGYDINRRMFINGKNTISLKGLKFGQHNLQHDVLVVQLPHPTALSTMKPQDASNAVRRALTEVKKYKDWYIEPDLDYESQSKLRNNFAEDRDYVYGRSDMGFEYYDFGAPNSRMVNVSTASRYGVNVIVFGSRDRVSFNSQKIRAMSEAKPSEPKPPSEMWITRSRLDRKKPIFDPGPGLEYAKIMKTSLPLDSAFHEKLKDNGDFGHYRGTFKSPKLFILADPDGYDDLVTARALTGTRGQYLQGLMNDLGIGDQVLIIKTAPYSMNGKDDPEWKDIFNKTTEYRSRLISAILENSGDSIKAFATDGEWAAQALRPLLPSSLKNKLVEIPRDPSGNDPKFGLESAFKSLKKVGGYTGERYYGKMADIPRSHLSYYARLWEGTSGDRVITSDDQRYRGKAFAFVAPYWAIDLKAYKVLPQERQEIEKLRNKLLNQKLRLGNEPITEYIERVGIR